MRTIFQLTSCLMVVLLPVVPVLADANAAMLSVTGSVSVNGKSVSHSTATFPGDRIQTGSDSTATLAAAGSTVVVPEKSVVVLQKNAVEVDSGRAIVATSRGMTAAARGLIVTPASKAARFELLRTDGALRVTVLEGSVSVSNGQQMTLVAAGQSLTSGEGFPAKPSRASSLGSHAIFIIAAAAVSTAIVIAIATTGEESVSPAVFTAP